MVVRVDTVAVQTQAGPRLSALTHTLAAHALSGEHGRNMGNATFGLPKAQGREPSEEQLYAQALLAMARHAPLRVLDGELIVGSATLLEAANHQTPVLGTPSTSHTTLAFHRVLREGYRGLRQRIEERLARGDLDAERRDLLEAMRLCLDAAAIWHGRYVALLKARIAEAQGEQRARYELVLAALEPVPEAPARTFHEAVQSLWFQYAFQRLAGNWSGIGRIDQMLGPYLEADLANGRLTLDEAREILAHFWIKGCEWVGAPTRHVGDSGDGQFYQNVVLAGIDSQGREVTNDVTYLVLDVVEELRISDWPIAVRVSERTPERLLRRIAEVQRLGTGTVAIYNEAMVLRALERFGYPPEVARTFANDGCWEVIIPGQTAFGYQPFDALQLLQGTLGVTRPDAAELAFPSFEALYAAYHARLATALEAMHAQFDRWMLGGRAAPLISLLIDDCIERGRGYHDRGARYTVRSPHAGGLPDVANSLLAIRKLVYEERRLSLGELVQILRDDWRGHEALRRSVRAELIAYGNDDATADAMLRRVYDDYVALAGAVHDRNGVLRPVGLSTFGRQIEWAEARGATAAGSHRGEYLANNFSPTPGTDLNGPTAVIQSFCSVDFEKLANGTALELKIHPSAIKGEAGVSALVGLMRTFLRLGGWFLHIDVVDSEMLRDAQRHPDRYPNLAVRISGWSARFVTLDRTWQDMIIARSEQEMS
ncbi:MAG: hypothetical protein JXA74_03585 [Anaerolineae bacterium]|nr:hypothetical protein [Anaerolineae bacterium]